MNTSKLAITTILALALSNTVYAEQATKPMQDCPSKTVTSAYLNYTYKMNDGDNIGKQYEDYMKAVNALPQTGNFKGFKITSQQVRYSPPYQRNDQPEVAITVNLEFELNYQALTDLKDKLKLTSLDMSTYDQKYCK